MSVHDCADPPTTAGLAVAVRADDDKVAFGEALALEPRLAASASIARCGELRHDSLKPMLGTGPKECRTIAGKFIAELDWAGTVSA